MVILRPSYLIPPAYTRKIATFTLSPFPSRSTSLRHVVCIWDHSGNVLHILWYKEALVRARPTNVDSVTRAESTVGVGKGSLKNFGPHLKAFRSSTRSRSEMKGSTSGEPRTQRVVTNASHTGRRSSLAIFWIDLSRYPSLKQRIYPVP